MKKLKFTAALLLSTGVILAQSSISDQTKSYDEIIMTGTKEQKVELNKDLRHIAKTSKSEEELDMVSNYLYRLGFQDSADSLRTVIAKKFPKGITARGEYIQHIYAKQTDAKSKEKSFNYILQNWPIDQAEENKIAYDYARSSLIKTFMDEGNKEKALHYLGEMNERFWRAQAFIPVATKFLQDGDTLTALPLIQAAIEDAEYFIGLPKEQQDNRAGFAAAGYPGYISQLVEVYRDQGKDKEALELIERAINLAPAQAARFSVGYFKALEANGRKLEALQQLEILYKEGNFSYKAKMESLYGDLNGSSKGIEGYFARLEEEVIKSIQADIAKSELFKAAPDFELLNMKGEKVSLVSLRGKVVVLDFWATWCQPCTRSFPGMKAAQEMYANDNEVEFLFINTWERDKDYKEKVPAFIAKNNYPFEVLYDDQKDPETGDILATKFNVSGIPAKFIIDKEGHIRYALTGAKPDVEYIKLEMRELIEAAKNAKKV